MICNCQKTPQITKQRQLNSCLHKSININLSSILDTFAFSQSSLERATSNMSTLTADLRTAAVASAAAVKKNQIVKPPMEAVVVNSIIYSKPSFCRISVDMGDVPLDKKPSTMTKGSCPNSNMKCFSETFCSPSVGFNGTNLNSNAASCMAGLATSSAFNGSEDAKVYRMCTTINGAIHHQISELCDNILAMAGFFGVTNNEHDDDSLIEFAYRDDGDYEDDDEEDDDEEDFMEDEDDYDDDEEVDDDNDVVDFSYECPIEPEPKFNCDKKKKVRFNTKPTVHVMHTWSYAYRAARKGEWEMYARDRDRFKLRIQRTALTLNPILQREHRQKIYEKRFANLYDNDEGQGQQYQTEINANAVSFEMKESKKTSTDNESKKPHQKKKRRKRRFCKMGNKHYF